MDLQGTLPHLPKSCLYRIFQVINFCHLTKYFFYLNKSLVTIFLFSSLSSAKKLTRSPLFSPITRLWEQIYQLSCLQMMSFAKCFAAFPIIFFFKAYGILVSWKKGKNKLLPHPLKNIHISLWDIHFLWTYHHMVQSANSCLVQVSYRSCYPVHDTTTFP